MKTKLTTLMVCAAAGAALSQTALSGPSSSQPPYFLGGLPGYSVVSVLSASDNIGGYKMVGIPDGLGAFDNGDGTFTLLMNHEIALPGGISRAHGQSGAFVSKWKINKTTLAVVSGTDLIQNANLWNGTGYTTYNANNSSTLAAFSRFCSADLAAPSAFYNSYTGRGTQERIYMNGEETGNEGRLMAHIVTGPNAGNSYELPWLGKFSCENSVACPARQDKTIVAGLDDSTPGQVYFYVGNKTNTGTELDKAGLKNGKLYGVSVLGLLNESNTLYPSANTKFSMIDMGNVAAQTGSVLNTNSNNMGVTNFLRPEDGCWDPSRPGDFYFVTTNAFNSPSRLWRLRFSDIYNPELGGTITAMLNGTEGQQMFDNITIDNSGHIMLCEDVGNNAHNGKMWMYTIGTGEFVNIGAHDPSRFISGGSNFLTQDEETSGVIDAQSAIGPGWFLFVTQAHYNIPGEIYEGGQLMAMYNPVTFTSNPEIAVKGNSNLIATGSATTGPANNTAFGNVNLYKTGQKTFAVENSGSGKLIIYGVDFIGADAGAFTMLNPYQFPVYVNPGSSINFDVHFSPVYSGSHQAVMHINNNDLDESDYNYALSGTGTLPEVKVSGNSQVIQPGSAITTTANFTDFGSLIYNNTVAENFSIRNNGTGDLKITSVFVLNGTYPAFRVVNAPVLPLVIAGGSSASFGLEFSPVIPGVKTATVVVVSDDYTNPAYSFAVKGEGLFDTGISESGGVSEALGLEPNPANHAVTIRYRSAEPGEISVSVFDMAGKLIHCENRQVESGSNSFQYPTGSLEAGTYFLGVTSKSESHFVKLIVNH
jgi:hypothetical protein